MKTSLSRLKLIAISLILSLSLPAFAHERDTLKCHFDDTSVFTDTLYPDLNGGFILGVNSMGDMEIAQKFGQAPLGDTVGTECAVPDEHQLNEVLVHFGAKRVGGPNDSVFVNVYGIDHGTGGPGALLGATWPVQMSFLDTSINNETYVDFLMQLPVVFTDSFFLSVVLPHGAGDTVGIISSTNGQALGTEMCWVKRNSTWSTVLAADSLDVDAVIFPIVGDATIGINELSSYVTHVSTYPNPANENLIVNYTIIKPVQQLTFTLYDISGKAVYSVPLNNSSTGEHKFNINLIGFSAGSYYYSFESDRRKFNGKLNIVK